MRDPKRIDRILKILGDLWKKYPDQRFGQMMINNNIIPDNMKTWQNEDDGFEEYLKAVLEAKK